MPRPDHLAFPGLDSKRPAVLDDDGAGSVMVGCRRRSRAWRSQCAGEAALPPRDICALAGLAISAAIWCPKPLCRRSTSRSPLKNNRPAITVGFSNSR